MRKQFRKQFLKQIAKFFKFAAISLILSGYRLFSYHAGKCLTVAFSLFCHRFLPFCISEIKSLAQGNEQT